MKFVDVKNDINDEGLKSAYEEANVQTWTQDELDAYEYAFMREEDEKARLDKAKKDGKYELVIELYEDGMPIEKIAKLSKMTLDEVKEIVEQKSDK